MAIGKNKKAEESPSRTPVESEFGSGNVFADLGLPNPELAILKAELVQHIRLLIKNRKLTQIKAGELLGLDQPKVSTLLRGGVSGLTIDRLFRFLNALGQRIEIRVFPINESLKDRHERTILVGEK